MSECPYPKKRFHLTRAAAMEDIATLKARFGADYTTLYPYKCPGREHWHLSSSRQGRVVCPHCTTPNLPAWFDARAQSWVVYAHGDCATQQVVRR